MAKYTWVDIGSSYLPSEIIAAFLWAQLEEAEAIIRQRLVLWELYHDAFGPLEAQGRLRRPMVPAGCQHNGHMYYVLLPTPGVREGFLKKLADRGINAVFHYVPLHSSPAGEVNAGFSFRLVGSLATRRRVVGHWRPLLCWPRAGEEVDAL